MLANTLVILSFVLVGTQAQAFNPTREYKSHNTNNLRIHRVFLGTLHLKFVQYSKDSCIFLFYYFMINKLFYTVLK